MFDFCHNLKLKSFKILKIGTVAHNLDDTLVLTNPHQKGVSETAGP